MNQVTDTIKTIEESRQGEAFYFTDNEDIKGLDVKRFYIESYGCQMNFSDSEIVASILADFQYSPTRDIESANLILLNTCSIREKAEETIRKRLRTMTATNRAQAPSSKLS